MRVEEDLLPLLRAAFDGACRPTHCLRDDNSDSSPGADPDLDGDAIAHAHATATAVAAAFTTGSAPATADSTDSAPAASLSSWLLPRPPRCASLLDVPLLRTAVTC